MKTPESSVQRLKCVVRGAVQGVGFRPFVYRLATGLRLGGWVQNSAQGVFIEAEGKRSVLEQFIRRFEELKPPRALLQSVEFSFLDPVGYEGFEIRPSDDQGGKTTLILPDIATCPDCRREIFDPADRRYRYPFTNCTNCGPRFSIIESLPYDRPNTSMRKFAMCPECAREYHDPLDRRFDAQPTACAHCGPHLELWDECGSPVATHDDALREAGSFIRAGKIVALKGLGGFQLLVDARNEEAVSRLRARKRREEKPFAVMFPSAAGVHETCEVSDLEARVLSSPESPMVLLRRRAGVGAAARSVAPGNLSLAVMLPYTPLHHLLMTDLGFPVVATSGNLSDEPICIDESEALERLRGIADVFLVHDRPIVRHMDDSIVRVIRSREMVLRRARGFAPLPVHVREPLPSILAVGAHLKNTVALSVGTEIFISQHIGDLETAQAHAAFQKVAADLPRLYETEPGVVACDLHPDYLSTQFASRSGLAQPVQHHWAHVLACMAENELEPPTLGVAWDGTGLGTDGTIWGGEFLLARDGGFERVACLRPFRLPGGEAAVKEPRRSALGVLHEMFGESVLRKGDLPVLRSFSKHELALIGRMLSRSVNAPVTTSAGRLFDAVAALLGLRALSTFEGQAAMDLEFAIGCDNGAGVFPFAVRDGAPLVIDWQPMVEAILDSVRGGESHGVIARKFHDTLAAMIVTIAERIGEEGGVLTGGCFQNKYLIERTVQCLEDAGFRPFWPRCIPPNDGGIALGQIVAAAHFSRAAAGARQENAELCRST